MMNWYGNGMNGWGYGLMGLSMLFFWALAIGAVIMLARYFAGPGRQTASGLPGQPTPEQILAERFARGDIDHEDYRQRLTALRGHVDS